MEILITNGQNEAFKHLCSLLDESLDKIVGNTIERGKYTQFNLSETIEHVVLLRLNGEMIGCAGLRKYDAATGEIKRVFVKETHRGKGYSKLLISKIEEIAKNKGFRKIILETGDILRASVNLYGSFGYTQIPNYGPYASLKESLCMGKEIQ